MVYGTESPSIRTIDVHKNNTELMILKTIQLEFQTILIKPQMLRQLVKEGAENKLFHEINQKLLNKMIWTEN